MAKFKKNFWNGTRRKPDGDVVPTPEPDWYAREKDPLDRLGGFKGAPNPRPDGVLIPKALVGTVEKPIKEAYAIYKEHCMESFVMKFCNFKTALINGTKFRTSKGVISKP